MRHALTNTSILKKLGRTLVLFVALFVTIGAPCAFCAKQDELPEYEVKAAFLFNFVKFVDWPAEVFADGKSPFVIGVLGDDPFGATLTRMLLGKTINGHRLLARRIARLDEIKDVHLLFVCRSEKERLPEILDAVNSIPVLCVSDAERASDRGAAISFGVENGRVVFDVNADAVARTGLRISSKLLPVARSVHQTATPK
jgi:hypothetical protein